MSVCAHNGGVRCWNCMTNGCYPYPVRHVWFDSEDIEHAAATGQPEPTGLCQCAFCGEPAFGDAPDPRETKD